MITAERVALETPRRPASSEPRSRPVPKAPSPQPEGPPRTSSLLWRLVLFFIGLGLVSVGWPLVVSGFGAFIGVPLVIIGLALMQAQES